MINVTNKKYFILDLDGTLYQGKQIFPYARPFIERLRATGRQPIFLTNNSSKSTEEYYIKLKKMGLAESAKEIYTSARATIEYLWMRGVRKIYLMAPPTVENEFKEAGFKLMTGLLREKKRESLLHKMCDAVVLAFDMTFTYQKFCIAHDFIKAGVPFYATHPDMFLPIENHQFHPDIGTLIAAFYAATAKKPFVIGKPQKHIYQQLHNHLKCKKEEMVMVGDRLSTDIKGANDYGIDTILVLSGETTKKMVNKKSLQPKLIVENVGTLTAIINIKKNSSRRP